MRDLVFPSATVVDTECAGLEALGGVGCDVGAWLRRTAGEERALVARSFSLYMSVLLPFAEMHSGTPAGAATTVAGIQQFFLRHGTTEWRRKLMRAVLRKFLVGSGRSVAALEDACRLLPALPKRTATDANNLSHLTRQDLAEIDAEVALLVNVAQQKQRDCDSVLRIALILMCRHAGALASDLAGLTFDDLGLPGAMDAPWAWTGEVSPLWRVLRVGAGEVGAAKRRIMALECPALARRWLTRWIALRSAMAPVSGGAPVFVDPASGEALDRQRVWRIVAGIGDPKAGKKSITAVGEDGTPKERVELNPARLRHALGAELVERAQGDDAQLVQWNRVRLGIEGRGLATKYRALLGDRVPDGRRTRRVRAG